MNHIEGTDRKKHWMESLVYEEETEGKLWKSMDLIRKALESDKFERLKSAMEKDALHRRPYDILKEQLSQEEWKAFEAACVKELSAGQEIADKFENVREIGKNPTLRKTEDQERTEKTEAWGNSRRTEAAVEITQEEMETIEFDKPAIQGPNMAEVQAAELKASIVQGLDRSADGNTQVEGQDIGYVEEGYVAAADQVKYEAQRARTADNEIRGQDGVAPKIGQRVTFQPHNTETKLVGNVVDMDDCIVTLQCGRTLIPTLRDKGTFTEARAPDRTHTKEYAKSQAHKHVGEQGDVFLARARSSTYKGAIVELTPTFAIQKVNTETVILHRLKDLETQEKDGHGAPLKENEEFRLIQEGKEVIITRESREKGGVRIESWDKEREERQKVRELERGRGSQSL
jgi:hypothetical protein